MNQSEPLIRNNYIVDESRIHVYIQKKGELMSERNCTYRKSIIYTLFITGLYYLDIGTDLNLFQKYYINGDIWWFTITLGIVVFSSLLNTLVLFSYSYFQEFKSNWKNKEYMRVVIKSFCLLFQLEMLFW
jgi:hypothetical protein